MFETNERIVSLKNAFRVCSSELSAFHLVDRDDFVSCQRWPAVLEYRWADGQYKRLPALFAEIVRLNVNVIVTHGTPGAQFAQRKIGSLIWSLAESVTQKCAAHLSLQ